MAAIDFVQPVVVAIGNADQRGDGFKDPLDLRVVTLERFIVVLLPGGHFPLALRQFLLALGHSFENAFDAIQPIVAVRQVNVLSLSLALGGYCGVLRYSPDL